ncbi:MAG: site-specific integrase [Pseudomonadota bacterium]
MADTSKFKKTKYPNIYETPSGGHYVRARVSDPSTDKIIQIKKTLDTKDPLEALQWLRAETDRIRSGVALPLAAKTRFSEFAAQLFENKVTIGDIKSAAGRTRWGSTLQHLIAGTHGDKTDKFVTGFGDVYIDKLHSSHIEEWKLGIAGLIQAGDYSPTTANGWLSILRVITKAAKRKFSLTHLATEDIDDFNTDDHITYTEEEPNALHPDQVPLFLERLRELHPQHYAMAFLGLATGLRPSSLRPLRRRGPQADIKWDEGKILIRRSQTRGEEVMQMTKQRTRYSITVPKMVLDVLTWHIEQQLRTPEQQDSDLLFPSTVGNFRSPTVLNKPFADVAEQLALPSFSQRGMRRTYNDLARFAKVDRLVKKSVSGHGTDEMEELYSSVAPEEQREGIAKVINLFGKGGARNSVGGPLSGPLGSPGGPQNGKTG